MKLNCTKKATYKNQVRFKLNNMINLIMKILLLIYKKNYLVVILFQDSIERLLVVMNSQESLIHLRVLRIIKMFSAFYSSMRSTIDF